MKQKLKINLIQFNPIVGDIDGNTNKILNYIKKSNSEIYIVIRFPRNVFMWIYT